MLYRNRSARWIKKMTNKAFRSVWKRKLKMMSTEQITRMSREAAEKAAQEDKYPLILEQEDKDDLMARRYDCIRGMPNLGDYRPDGWQLTNREDGCYGCGGSEGMTLVDSSGFGSRGELALTIDQFAEWLRVGYGYAIIEEGQFQVVVGEFERV